jgi:hypothetical protein
MGHGHTLTDDLALVAYVGVMPHFRKMPKMELASPNLYPYALGHSLYLDIVKDS